MPAPTWTLHGQGNYNRAYKSEDGTLILKIQKNISNTTDEPERAVRLWNELNHHISPQAYVTDDPNHGKGWVCPFITGKQASDKEISAALVDIFNHSGRIVVDASSPKNFVATPAPNRKIVCVDIGMALQLEERGDLHCSHLTRSKSPVSLDAWSDLTDDYPGFFKDSKKNNPLTINTVKALLFVKSNRPDINDASFLKNNPLIIKKLAKAHDYQDNSDQTYVLDVLANLDKIAHEDKQDASLETKSAMLAKHHLLHTIKPMHLNKTKKNCIGELYQYINSRGSMNDKGEFEPSFITHLFRSSALTAKKVEATCRLIKTISKAGSLAEIKTILEEAKKQPDILTTKYSSGLEASIDQCMLMLNRSNNYVVRGFKRCIRF